jgi:hypothetical protein
MFIKSQTVFAGRGITATPYNDRWLACFLTLRTGGSNELTIYYRRKHRRIATAWLNQRAVDSYTLILDQEATVLVKSMYQQSKAGAVPINPQVSLRRCMRD